jgi:transcriptional regulator with XRE-family HTH domain
MSLGENIYKYRASKCWSQAELAEALDVSRQSVSKWENDLATPDLDKLIKMKIIFNISLDELVFGEALQPHPTDEGGTSSLPRPFRTYIGMALMIFGMVFFLLSIFWGDHLYFGEAFGELLSAVIVLVSVAMIVPYDFKVLAVCVVIFLLYSVVSFGILHISNPINSIFLIVASLVLTVWFIICGEHATRDKDKSKDASVQQ